MLDLDCKAEPFLHGWFHLRSLETVEQRNLQQRQTLQLECFRLAYRCEPLLGAKGELVLIIDYRKLQAVRRRLSCGAFGNALARRAAQQGS
eukprot:g28330.t1